MNAPMDENMQNSLTDFKSKSQELLNKINSDAIVVFETIKEKASKMDSETNKVLEEILNNAKSKNLEINKISSDLEISINHFKEFQTKAENDINNNNQKYDQLCNQLESLLPSATSIGLAVSYAEEKQANLKKSTSMDWVFYCSIILMIIASIYLVFIITISDNILENYIHKFFIYFPLIWLASFSSKQQSQHKRLAAEYAHKECLCKSYEGYKNVIRNNLKSPTEQNELSEKLMHAILEASKANPSATLDKKSHNQKPPISDAVENITKK